MVARSVVQLRLHLLFASVESSRHGRGRAQQLTASSNKPYILSILSYMHVIYENIHKRVFCSSVALRRRVLASRNEVRPVAGSMRMCRAGFCIRAAVL